MYQVILVIHVLLGLSVVGLVLIQQGKGADAGAAFGSGSSGSVFGAQGAASFLSRSTAVLATLFFSTSLGLAVLISYQEADVDLMSASDTEEIFADVPLVDSNTGVIPTLSPESIPVIKEGLPTEISEGISSTMDTAIEEVQAVVDTTEQKVQDIVEETNAVASEIFDTPAETTQ